MKQHILMVYILVFQSCHQFYYTPKERPNTIKIQSIPEMCTLFPLSLGHFWSLAKDENMNGFVEDTLFNDRELVTLIKQKAKTLDSIDIEKYASWMDTEVVCTIDEKRKKTYIAFDYKRFIYILEETKNKNTANMFKWNQELYDMIKRYVTHNY